MSPRAPLEALSSLALDIWRFGLDDKQANALDVMGRVESKMGVSLDPYALSQALRDLVSGGWAHRGMAGFRRVLEHCERAAPELPLEAVT